jgi:hypothetical protein
LLKKIIILGIFGQGCLLFGAYNPSSKINGTQKPSLKHPEKNKPSPHNGLLKNPSPNPSSPSPSKPGSTTKTEAITPPIKNQKSLIIYGHKPVYYNKKIHGIHGQGKSWNNNKYHHSSPFEIKNTNHKKINHKNHKTNPQSSRHKEEKSWSFHHLNYGDLQGKMFYHYNWKISPNPKENSMVHSLKKKFFVLMAFIITGGLLWIYIGGIYPLMVGNSKV